VDNDFQLLPSSDSRNTAYQLTFFFSIGTFTRVGDQWMCRMFLLPYNAFKLKTDYDSQREDD
jgi:hypothetical protein